MQEELVRRRVVKTSANGKNAVTAVITVLHSLLFVASAVKCSAESIGTTEVVNP